MFGELHLFPAPVPAALAATGIWDLEVDFCSQWYHTDKTSERQDRGRFAETTLESEPLGLDVQINENPMATPGTILTWQHQKIHFFAPNHSERICS